MNNVLKIRIDRAFNLTFDLIQGLREDELLLKLHNLPSNRIIDQLWCVVGARESYIKAIHENGWQGFSCSLEPPITKISIVAGLKKTYNSLCDCDFSNLNTIQQNLGFDLLEHEIQHHGQLIRVIYGNKLQFPNSWNERYTV